METRQVSAKRCYALFWHIPCSSPRSPQFEFNSTRTPNVNFFYSCPFAYEIVGQPHGSGSPISFHLGPHEQGISYTNSRGANPGCSRMRADSDLLFNKLAGHPRTCQAMLIGIMASSRLRNPAGDHCDPIRRKMGLITCRRNQPPQKRGLSNCTSTHPLQRRKNSRRVQAKGKDQGSNV